MRPNLGLEMDEKANVMITFECARCKGVQKRAFRLTSVEDVVTCACGATAALTEEALVALQAQVELLRAKVAEMNTTFAYQLVEPMRAAHAPRRSPSTARKSDRETSS